MHFKATNKNKLFAVRTFISSIRTRQFMFYNFISVHQCTTDFAFYWFKFTCVFFVLFIEKILYILWTIYAFFILNFHFNMKFINMFLNVVFVDSFGAFIARYKISLTITLMYLKFILIYILFTNKNYVPIFTKKECLHNFV